jgi:hypothetical protein
MERVTGIEPVFHAWEARIIPLYYTRNGHKPTRSVEKGQVPAILE